MSKEIHAKPSLSEFTVRLRANGIWVVIKPDGGVTGDQFDSKRQAEARARELQIKLDAEKRKGPRACITCGDEFLSEGVHNRMCSCCRRSGGDALGWPVSLTSGRARGQRRAG